LFSQKVVSYDYYDTKLPIFLEENFGQESRESQLGENDARDAILNHEFYYSYLGCHFIILTANQANFANFSWVEAWVATSFFNHGKALNYTEGFLGMILHFLTANEREYSRMEDLGCWLGLPRDRNVPPPAREAG